MKINKVLGNGVEKYVSETDSYMQSRLGDIEQEELRMACQHLPRAGGKRLRPILFLTVHEMFGENYRDVLPIAAGIESLHVSTLIQDDLPLMDDDKMRRGSEAVHVRFDEATASLASSIMQSKAYGWCNDADICADLRTKIIQEMDETMTRIGVGQDMDVRFEDEVTVSKEDYIKMATDKTAYLYRSSARMGGLANNVNNKTMENLSTYGLNLGISFQIIDDLLDFKEFGTGKDHYSDIRNKKCTFVTIDAKSNGVPVFDEGYSVEERVEMIKSCGSLERAVETAREYIQIADAGLESISDVETPSMSTLQKISRVAVNRTK